MISLHTEHVVRLEEAASLLPARKGGKRVTVSTLYRWASRGHRGVVLETLQVGGSLCTSAEALERFCQRCTEKKSKGKGPQGELMQEIEKHLDEVGM